jgi:hypothetical protein
MQFLKQSTAAVVMLKVFLSSDHITAATGKTLTVTLSKNGGAFAAAGGSVAEVASGWYAFSPNTTDSNTLGPLVVRATAASCDDAEDKCQVVADLPGASVASVSGAVGSVTAGVTVSGVVSANVTKINGTSVTGNGSGTPWGP